jgi:hypothetical protein
VSEVARASNEYEQENSPEPHNPFRRPWESEWLGEGLQETEVQDEVATRRADHDSVVADKRLEEENQRNPGRAGPAALSASVDDSAVDPPFGVVSETFAIADATPEALVVCPLAQVAPRSPQVSLAKKQRDVYCPMSVTHAFSLKDSELSHAILARRKEIENRNCKFSPGWYCVHTSKANKLSLPELHQLRHLCRSKTVVHAPHSGNGAVTGLAFVGKAVSYEQLCHEAGCTCDVARHIQSCKVNPFAAGPQCHIITAAFWLLEPVACRGNTRSWPLPPHALESVRAQLRDARMHKVVKEARVAAEQVQPVPSDWPVPWLAQGTPRYLYQHMSAVPAETKATHELATLAAEHDPTVAEKGQQEWKEEGAVQMPNPSAAADDPQPSSSVVDSGAEAALGKKWPNNRRAVDARSIGAPNRSGVAGEPSPSVVDGLPVIGGGPETPQGKKRPYNPPPGCWLY